MIDGHLANRDALAMEDLRQGRWHEGERSDGMTSHVRISKDNRGSGLGVSMCQSLWRESVARMAIDLFERSPVSRTSDWMLSGVE